MIKKLIPTLYIILLIAATSIVLIRYPNYIIKLHPIFIFLYLVTALIIFAVLEKYLNPVSEEQNRDAEELEEKDLLENNANDYIQSLNKATFHLLDIMEIVRMEIPEINDEDILQRMQEARSEFLVCLSDAYEKYIGKFSE